MKKINQAEGIEGLGVVENADLGRVDREGLAEEGEDELGPKQGKRTSYVKVWGRLLKSEESKCAGPEGEGQLEEV